MSDITTSVVIVIFPDESRSEQSSHNQQIGEFIFYSQIEFEEKSEGFFI